MGLFTFVALAAFIALAGNADSKSASPSPSPSPSLCLPGWSHYINDGTEASDSCTYLTPTLYTTWMEASTSCPFGSHLVTVRSANASVASTGLMDFISNTTSSNFWMGMSQSSLASFMNRGWVWVDGTNSTNLNCGSPNSLGCGIWSPSEPNDHASGSEHHREDFGNFLQGTGRASDECVPGWCLPAQGAICETEVSVRCPVGWAFYADDGSEGADSCVFVSSTLASSWTAANASCPTGSHLLTVKSPISTSGLLPFATSLYHGPSGFAYIGCRHTLYFVGIVETLFGLRKSRWQWVDGTSSSNLNCGGSGCGLWNSSYPIRLNSDVEPIDTFSDAYCLVSVDHMENQVANNRLFDEAYLNSHGYICEMELESDSGTVLIEIPNYVGIIIIVVPIVVLCGCCTCCAVTLYLYCRSRRSSKSRSSAGPDAPGLGQHVVPVAPPAEIPGGASVPTFESARPDNVSIPSIQFSEVLNSTSTLPYSRDEVLGAIATVNLHTSFAVAFVVVDRFMSFSSSDRFSEEVINSLLSEGGVSPQTALQVMYQLRGVRAAAAGRLFTDAINPCLPAVPRHSSAQPSESEAQSRKHVQVEGFTPV